MAEDDAKPQSSQSLMDDQLGITPDATVHVPSSLSVRLESVSSSSSFELSSQTCRRANVGGRCWLVGRQAATADLRLPQAGLSRQHAVLYIVRRDGDNLQLLLKDLGSKHGTTVNGARIATGSNSTVALRDGDVVQFGAGPEPAYRVRIQQRLDNGLEQPDSAAATAATTEVTGSAPSISAPSEERSLVDLAGQGLEGRARRQAEIAAMMASLDEAPAYNPAAVPSAEGGSEVGNDGASQDEARDNQSQQLAQQHGVPLQRRLTLPSEVQRGTVTCLAVDAAGSRFVAGGTDTHLRWYDFSGLGRGKLESFRDSIPEDGHLLQACVFSPTGDRLLVATSSVQPQVFDREGQDVIKFCRGDMYVTDPAKTIGHTAQVTSADWHPLDRNVVLTGSLDGSARLWNLTGKTQFKMLVCDRVFAVKSAKGQRTAVTSVAFHPGGRELAVGTVCGSIQTWSRARATVTRPERAVYEAHGGGGAARPVHSLVYSLDGTHLASRSADDDTVRIWNPQRLSRSSRPLVVCTDLETAYEHANACFSPDGTFLCAGQSTIKGQGDARRESGALHVYQVPESDEQPLESSTPLLSLPLDGAPVLVLWHPKLNQIFVACSDGRVLVFFDPERSTKGALLAASRETRPVDALSELLRSKAESAVPNQSEILTPLSMPKGELESERKRKRQERKDPIKSREPERPATGKHKTGAQTGGILTFQQFVADQRVSQSKAIAGKDPREALLHYTDGKSYVGAAYEGNLHKLAEKTAEQEEEEMKAKKTHGQS